MNVCVRLAPESRTGSDFRFAVIPFGLSTHRILTLQSAGGYAYTLMEELVAKFVDRFFQGEEVLECVPFRITRNADIAVRDDTASDLLVDMEELLDARKTSDCVRLEIADRVGPEMLSFLRQSLEVNDEDVFRTAGPLALSDFLQLADVQGCDHLRYPPWRPQPSPDIDPSATMFEIVSGREIVLCHPYESFRSGCAVNRRSSRRSGRVSDQANTLPHQPRELHRSRLGEGRATRQVRHGDCRVEGQIRRSA